MDKTPQSLKGFNEEFANLTDYILKITHRIWEERRLGDIRSYYGRNAPVYTPMGISRDVEDVVKSTHETLVMFPDRKLLGETVISGEKQDDTYLSSHRIFSTMTHNGEGLYGPATNRRIHARTIADCLCKNNQVVEEWMVRDQSAMLHSMGLDVETFGRSLARQLHAEKRTIPTKKIFAHWQISEVLGKKQIPPSERRSLHIIEGLRVLFAGNALHETKDFYDRSARVHVPGGKTLHGWEEITEYFNTLLAAFSNAEWSPSHYLTTRERNLPAQLTLRWTLKGTHTGWGLYGKPSDAEVHIMGISHFNLHDQKIIEAFHVFDEVSIWMQIEEARLKT